MVNGELTNGARQGGVALQHPSWGGNDVGWAPMPIGRLAPVFTG
jgi:hypothetical protein